MARYNMDDATFQHLTDWCDSQVVEREGQTEDSADLLRETILVYLQSCDVEDAEYSISHGWTHVRNLAEAK